MGGFGEPVAGAGFTATQEQEALPSTEVQDLLDPNDPRLVSETLDADVTKDAYAKQQLPPDGKYRAKVKLEGIDKGDGNKVDYVAEWTKKPPKVPFYKAVVSASIIDPTGKFDNFTVRPAFGGYVSTQLRNDKSTTVSTLLSKIKKPDGQYAAVPTLRIDQKSWMELLVRTLAGEPEVIIETEWECSCEACGKEGKALRDAGKDAPFAATTRGMHRFPAEQDKAKRAEGQIFSPEVKCAANAAHGYSRAYPKIVRFLSLDEVKK